MPTPKLLRSLKNALVADEVKLHRVLFGFPAGCRLPLNLSTQAHVFFGLYEIEVSARMKAAVGPDTVFFDVGAGSGYYAVGAAKRIRSGRVVAFEADPEAVSRLRTAIEANHASDRVDVVEAFVSDRSATGYTTIDDTVAAGAPLPHLMKIDVEGAEASVLAGAEKVIDEARPVLFIETHSQEVDEQCQSFLTDKGYRFEIIESRSFRESRPIDFNRWLWAEPQEGLG